MSMHFIYYVFEKHVTSSLYTLLIPHIYFVKLYNFREISTMPYALLLRMHFIFIEDALLFLIFFEVDKINGFYLCI